ncbi:hypothetical protein L1887_58450 [Cichorium endivia]|nr:hypothetical protein L1887_58450 [Cichorium endivia]
MMAGLDDERRRRGNRALVGLAGNRSLRIPGQVERRGAPRDRTWGNTRQQPVPAKAKCRLSDNSRQNEKKKGQHRNTGYGLDWPKLAGWRLRAESVLRNAVSVAPPVRTDASGFAADASSTDRLALGPVSRQESPCRNLRAPTDATHSPRRSQLGCHHRHLIVHLPFLPLPTSASHSIIPAPFTSASEPKKYTVNVAAQTDVASVPNSVHGYHRCTKQRSFIFARHASVAQGHQSVSTGIRIWTLPRTHT